MFSRIQLVAVCAALLGVGFFVLALSQYNSLVMRQTEVEIARPLTEAQVAQAAETLRQLGKSEEEISALEKQALDSVDDALSKMSNAFWQSIFIDLGLGIVFLGGGLFLYPEHGQRGAAI